MRLTPNNISMSVTVLYFVLQRFGCGYISSDVSAGVGSDPMHMGHGERGEQTLHAKYSSVVPE